MCCLYIITWTAHNHHQHLLLPSDMWLSNAAATLSDILHCNKVLKFHQEEYQPSSLKRGSSFIKEGATRKGSGVWYKSSFSITIKEVKFAARSDSRGLIAWNSLCVVVALTSNHQDLQKRNSSQLLHQEIASQRNWQESVSYHFSLGRKKECEESSFQVWWINKHQCILAWLKFFHTFQSFNNRMK